MRLTTAEKVYLGHFVQAHRDMQVTWQSFFMGEEELQAVASLHRRGLVTMEPDYEGHYVNLSEEAHAWLVKHAKECHDLWLLEYTKAKAVL